MRSSTVSEKSIAPDTLFLKKLAITRSDEEFGGRYEGMKSSILTKNTPKVKKF